MDDARSRYLKAGRAERRLQKYLQRGRPPPARIADQAVAEKQAKADAYLDELGAEQESRGFFRGPGFHQSTAAGAPVLVFGVEGQAGREFWLRGGAGQLHPNLVMTSRGSSPTEINRLLGEGTLIVEDPEFVERISRLAVEERQQIEADPNAPISLGITTSAVAYLRSGPREDADLVAELESGTAVVVFEFDGSWARVRAVDKAAWRGEGPRHDGWLSTAEFD